MKRKFCIDCDAELFDVARNTQRCELCNKWHRTAYMKWYNKRRKRSRPAMGTTDFSSHRKEDFTMEYLDILDEMDKLGIQKNVKYVEKANIYI